MFESHRCFERSRLVFIGTCKPKVFRHNLDGSFGQSFDYSVEDSDPMDFQLDNLISARVPLSAGPNVESLDLNSLDNVESASMRILESDEFIVKSDSNKKS